MCSLWVTVLAGVLSPSVAEAGQAACRELRIDAMYWAPPVTGSWTLIVDGDAAVVSAGEKEHRFRLSGDACSELIRVVNQEAFFALRASYGTPVIDGGMRNLKIGIGKRQHAVAIPTDLSVAAEDRAAVKRAVRVWIAVRALFNVAEAVDSRDRDRAFLKE